MPKEDTIKFGFKHMNGFTIKKFEDSGISLKESKNENKRRRAVK